VPQQTLEQSLRNLPSVGTLVKDRGYRQVWRFVHEGKAYYLKFYLRRGWRDRFRRVFRGSPAAREFHRLQWLQKEHIPAPRAIAFLAGFRINDRTGDSLILEAVEPSIALDELLSQRELAGQPVPEHRLLARQVIDLVHKLGQSRLGHDDLHLGNFLLHNGRVVLIDAYALRPGGLRQRDVLRLGASVNRFATKTDLLRGWRKLVGDEPLPRDNPVSREHWRDSIQRVGEENRYFGKLRLGEWTGWFFRHTKHPRCWSVASRLTVGQADWERAWPILLAQLERDELKVLKRSRSGDVVAGTIELAGQSLEVVIKRPRRRYWYRYLNEIGRGARARRAWFKAWNLILRNLATAWPVAVMEKRSLGYVVDTVIIFERVPGPTLASIQLDEMNPPDRDRLLRRTGRILRQIERLGFSHFDAKSSNWIVRDDAAVGPTPVLIDVDGIRRRRWIALGIRRLLRSLRDHKQYTPEDSLALCQGYAPYSRIAEEPAPDEPAADASASEENTGNDAIDAPIDPAHHGEDNADEVSPEQSERSSPSLSRGRELR
jgi:tRNA A-37 threonylcarbamoyl transferase component Bud32